MIVIVGKDKDFSHTLAEQVVRELAEPCECVDSPEELKRLAQQHISLVVMPSGAKPENLPTLSLTPPIRLREALADISSLLKQAGSKDKDTVAIASGLTLAERTKELTHASGKSAGLTDKEAQLLKALAGAGPQGIGKDQLLSSVWGIEADLNTHTLETHIYRLRGKIKELSGSEMIASTEGGYRLEKIS